MSFIDEHDHDVFLCPAHGTFAPSEVELVFGADGAVSALCPAANCCDGPLDANGDGTPTIMTAAAHLETCDGNDPERAPS